MQAGGAAIGKRVSTKEKNRKLSEEFPQEVKSETEAARKNKKPKNPEKGLVFEELRHRLKAKNSERQGR